MMPYSIVQSVSGSIALLESTTPLGLGGSIASNVIETVDFLQGRHNSRGIGGIEAGIIYDYTPSGAVPYFWLDYFIYANGAANAIAPGDLRIDGYSISPATPPTLVSAIVGRVRYAGDRVHFNGGADWQRQAAAITGSLRVNARQIQVIYVNTSIAQTVFRLGVYLRAS